MLKSLIRGKFIGSRSVNNPPEHFVNNQVLTVGIGPYENATEVLSVGGDALIAPLGTSPERSEKASTSVPLAPCIIESVAEMC